LKAQELDNGNLSAEKRYGLATLYEAWGENQKALQLIESIPVPGFYWYHLHSTFLQDLMGDKESARKNFEMIRKNKW
jgi:hypothetical protein